MDQMISYCKNSFEQSSSSNKTTTAYDSSENLFVVSREFLDNEIDLDNVDHSYYTKQISTLVTQCRHYETIIKRQENEITYYQKHIETMEDDFVKVNECLSDANKNVKIYRDKIFSYEMTIDSLENEVNVLNSRMTDGDNRNVISFSNDNDCEVIENFLNFIIVN